MTAENNPDNTKSQPSNSLLHSYIANNVIITPNIPSSYHFLSA